MKYKIGEVSRILDIPIDTIRFYQKQGIVAPRRDADNNYAYFDESDMRMLLRYKKHRGLGFSTKEIAGILSDDDFEAYLSRCRDKQKDIEDSLNWFNLLRMKNQNYINVLSSIPWNLGRYTLTEQPEAYYFINRKNDLYVTKDKLEGVFENWMQFYPFIENYYSISCEDIARRRKECDYRFGFTIKKQWADALHVLINEHVQIIPRRKAVYTVMQTTDDQPFTSDMFMVAVDFIEAHQLHISGDVQGNILTELHEGNHSVRHMEVWIPVES